MAEAYLSFCGMENLFATFTYCFAQVLVVLIDLSEKTAGHNAMTKFEGRREYVQNVFLQRFRNAPWNSPSDSVV